MLSTRKLSQITALLVAFILLGVLTQEASAKTRCQPTPQGKLCTSEVDFVSFAQGAYQNQRMSQWCWAASISMLYNYYKHPISQPRIVAEAYGTIQNIPAVSGFVIARQLNRDWADDRGKTFSARLTAAYVYDAGIAAIDNNWIINELDNDRPIIIGTRSHAVVGTAIRYYVTPYGPYIVGIGVFDPWPGVGARGLSPVEMTPMHVHPQGGLRFIATIKVTEL